ncbi:MAG: hypothetical protein ABEK16_06320 [Candidatus Nanohalobium sp.]
MKKHAKKALSHEVSVLGKTVPTLAIAALFLVGGGTAATLTYFGQVTGTANVDQAVLVNGNPGETTVDIFDGSEPITAGETVVDTFQISNNMDSAYSPAYNSELSYDGNTLTQTGADIDWVDSSDNQVGIDTTFANYFRDAGHNFSAVSATRTGADVVVDPTDDGSTDTPDTISAGIEEVTEDTDDGDREIVFVAQRDSGSYSGFTLDKAGVSVVSNGAKVKGNIEIAADNFRLSGFEVVDAENSANNDIIRVQTNSVDSGEISNLLINGKGTSDTGTGIYLNHANAASNLVIKHNTIKNAWAGIGGTESFEGSINYNVFKSNDEAIGVGDDEFSTEGNRFENNVASFRVYDTGKYSSSSPSVDASGNFFHEPFNIEYKGDMGESDVSASYQTVDSVPAGETVTVGVVNEFDLMINGAYDYTLTTDITTN